MNAQPWPIGGVLFDFLPDTFENKDGTNDTMVGYCSSSVSMVEDISPPSVRQKYLFGHKRGTGAPATKEVQVPLPQNRYRYPYHKRGTGTPTTKEVQVLLPQKGYMYPYHKTSAGTPPTKQVQVPLPQNRYRYPYHKTSTGTPTTKEVQVHVHTAIAGAASQNIPGM